MRKHGNRGTQSRFICNTLFLQTIYQI